MSANLRDRFERARTPELSVDPDDIVRGGRRIVRRRRAAAGAGALTVVGFLGWALLQGGSGEPRLAPGSGGTPTTSRPSAQVVHYPALTRPQTLMVRARLGARGETMLAVVLTPPREDMPFSVIEVHERLVTGKALCWLPVGTGQGLPVSQVARSFSGVGSVAQGGTACAVSPLPLERVEVRSADGGPYRQVASAIPLTGTPYRLFVVTGSASEHRLVARPVG